MKVKVKCVQSYWDVQLHPDANDPNKVLEVGYTWLVDKERADELVGKGLVEIVEILKEDKPEENKKLPTKKVNKR